MNSPCRDVTNRESRHNELRHRRCEWDILWCDKQETDSAMNREYQYFDRELSWLSFNYRVLLEADNEVRPLAQRVSFLSIYSSNMEEFYKVRVADLKSRISRKKALAEVVTDLNVEHDEQTLKAITQEVNRQRDEREHIYTKSLLPALEKEGIHLYQTPQVEYAHKDFVRNYFREEVFPFLQPVPIRKGLVHSFLRESRQYLAVRLREKQEILPRGTYGKGTTEYFILRIPFTKNPRFVELPLIERKRYFMFLEDLITANLSIIFPGYDIEESRSIKISRDADILIESASSDGIVELVKKKIKKRKIGAVCRFVYDRQISPSFLNILTDAFAITNDDLVENDSHLNLEDLRTLPITIANEQAERNVPDFRTLKTGGKCPDVFAKIREKDQLLYYPYHSFDPLLRWFNEAARDPRVSEIMITQYRVAQNSAVINSLIAAAQNGKKVTVFVELKARFDEANNLATAELMQRAGIHTIYSIPGFKVHTKVALVLLHPQKIDEVKGYAYISTGNFNERTAEVYADIGLFTCNSEIVDDLHQLFSYLNRSESSPRFTHLLVPPFNLLDTLTRLIRREIDIAHAGGKGRIVLKMNALQERGMIDLLYKASEAGVEIDLIVRGICCLIPNRPFSQNIRVTRIVDSYLEHARIWYFGANGQSEVYIGSTDFMQRNLYRRIEAVVPVLDPYLRDILIHTLELQLAPSCESCFVDEYLQNQFKETTDNQAKSDTPQHSIQDSIRAYLASLSLTDKEN